MLIKTDMPFRNGVGYLTDPGRFEQFHELYLAVRRKENRVFSDAQVALLPDVPPGNPHKHEWLQRADTLVRFMKYVKKHQPQGPVLDIGCGNGWFTRYLKESTRQAVVGLDVNPAELEQAARVFSDEDLFFVFGDIFEDLFIQGRFYLIIMNSSIQYFQDMHAILERLSNLLAENGEIHLLDSPFYADEADAFRAKERSRIYYGNLGFPEMIASYHHHHYNELNILETLRADLIYDPGSLKNGLIKAIKSSLSPFPWIRIRSK